MSADERQRATALFAGLSRARTAWRVGERQPDALERLVAETAEPAGLDLEYVAFRDPENWSAGPLEPNASRALALVAARIGPVRLIDNLRLDGTSA